MQHKEHHVDFCVVGGGLAGTFAAVAAARRGSKVVLIQDRPVLGGNASSEIRMHICGARGVGADCNPSQAEDNLRETGLLEEIELENRYRNPQSNYSIWDSILYGMVKNEPNLTVLFNASVCDAKVDGDRIHSVKAWQLTTYSWQTVYAKNFADCSGDSILATLTGAEYKVGREAASEHDEDIAPKVADKKTLGLSCLIQARETNKPVTFIPPEWANTYPDDSSFGDRDHELPKANFWWIELGGDRDTIADTEELRDELLKVAFGVWDHIKNQTDHGAENWALEWVGFLPGKRESRRYVGDHQLTQNDLRSGGKFDDIVAYGGWPMDDHHPKGFKYQDGHPTQWHAITSPYGIPYRSLYSRNIENLFFAGRNISATHAALTSTRVMATCSLLGQAIGTAAAIASVHNISCRQVYTDKIKLLQQHLMEDDCYLPGLSREIPKLCQNATLEATGCDGEVLRNGNDRPINNTDNGWVGITGEHIVYDFGIKKNIGHVRLVFDSDLNRKGMNMYSNYSQDMQPFTMPTTMVKAFRIEALDVTGQWRQVGQQKNNYKRLVKVPLNIQTTAIRLIPETTWGSEKVRIFAFDIYESSEAKMTSSNQEVSEAVSRTIASAQKNPAKRTKTITK